ncbi:MAG: hypothetical protein MUF54_18350, partial [Polyangiaceae bacterium]|nr:hypothetical protein [Polyangiaceae bacterium]
MRLLVRPAPDLREGLPEYLLRLADVNGVASVRLISGLSASTATTSALMREVSSMTGQPLDAIGALGPGIWTRHGKS